MSWHRMVMYEEDMDDANDVHPMACNLWFAPIVMNELLMICGCY